MNIEENKDIHLEDVPPEELAKINELRDGLLKRLTEKWEFSCPKCGSQKRVGQIIVDEDREAKRLGDHIKIGAMSVTETPVIDKQKKAKPGDEVSVIIRFTDNCSECGTDYTFRILREIRKLSLDVSHLIQKPTLMPPQGLGGLGRPRGN